jgi:hypothetical protein
LKSRFRATKKVAKKLAKNPAKNLAKNPLECYHAILSEEVRMQKFTVATDDVSVDSILWQVFGIKATASMLDYVLEMPENRHLEHQKAILAVGVDVFIPEEIPGAQDTGISLWEE